MPNLSHMTDAEALVRADRLRIKAAKLEDKATALHARADALANAVFDRQDARQDERRMARAIADIPNNPNAQRAKAMAPAALKGEK